MPIIQPTVFTSYFTAGPSVSPSKPSTSIAPAYSGKSPIAHQQQMPMIHQLSINNENEKTDIKQTKTIYSLTQEDIFCKGSETHLRIE